MITASKIPIDCTDFAKVYISFLKSIVSVLKWHFSYAKSFFTQLNGMFVDAYFTNKLNFGLCNLCL